MQFSPASRSELTGMRKFAQALTTVTTKLLDSGLKFDIGVEHKRHVGENAAPRQRLPNVGIGPQFFPQSVASEFFRRRLVHPRPIM